MGVVDSLTQIEKIFQDAWNGTQLRTLAIEDALATIGDGDDVAEGSRADTPWDGLAVNASTIALLKRLAIQLLTTTKPRSTQSVITRPSAVGTGGAKLVNARSQRLGGIVSNESAGTIYLSFFTQADNTHYSVQVATTKDYPIPADYTGEIWAASASATAQTMVTEFIP